MRIAVVCLSLLFFLTFFGTLHQVEYGLYEAQQRYFYSLFFLLFDIVPFPGTRLILWVLFVNLLSTAIFKLHYRWANAGIIVIHLGILSFFPSAFISFHQSQHSVMTLMEGQSSNVSEGYHEWEISIWKDVEVDGNHMSRQITAIDTHGLLNEGRVDIEALGVGVEPVFYYRNSQPYTGGDDPRVVSANQISRIEELPPRKSPEENAPGGRFVVHLGDERHEIFLFGFESDPVKLTYDGDTYHFQLRRHRFVLPFELQLVDFERTVHAGTQIPRGFQSRVALLNDGAPREVVISMNKPLRSGNFTFFQHQFTEDERGSVFAVVENPGRLLPYISSSITCFGLALHFLIMMIRSIGRARRKRVATAMLLGALMLPGLAEARGDFEPRIDVDRFEDITILHGGRRMPMDSFARVVTLQLVGRSSVDGEPATHWLARHLFDPDSTAADPAFLINNPEVVDILGIEDRDERRFSYEQIGPRFKAPKVEALLQEIIETDDDERENVEKELLRVYQAKLLYEKLMTSLRFDEPHQDFTISAETAKHLGEGEARTVLSPLGVVKHRDLLRKTFLASHQEGADQLDPFQREVFELVANLYARKRFFEQMNLPLTLLPADEQANEWLAPWHAASDLKPATRLFVELESLSEMKAAFLEGNQGQFNAAVMRFTRAVDEHTTVNPHGRFPALEVNYNKVRPFFYAKVCYFIAFLCACLSLVMWERRMFLASMALILMGLLLQTYGIAVRMLVMGRPPVTNLYATFLFVSWICVLIGILVTRMSDRSLGSILGSFCGFTLLMVSAKFASDGDTMGVLVAVLDSNFWLSTHVVTITAGYAGCCFAGVAGHLYLLFRIFAPKRQDLLRSAYGATVGVLGFGLVFSFLGTVLGGIWADQSWGRFWGWDPKENGALLIVLWCAILFHAKLGGMIREVGVAAGSVLGIIVVMLAWFGVNLLGEGLHSYGFTSGAFTTMMVYFAAEIVFVIVTTTILQARAQRALAARAQA